MEVVDLMSGAQGEEEYKEGEGSHCGHDWIIIFLMAYLNLLLSSVVYLRLQCCLAQGFSKR